MHCVPLCDCRTVTAHGHDAIHKAKDTKTEGRVFLIGTVFLFTILNVLQFEHLPLHVNPLCSTEPFILFLSNIYP